MRYIQICYKILNEQNKYPQCIIDIAENICFYNKKKQELTLYFVKNNHILKDYRRILSEVIKNGDKGIAATRVTFLELRKIYPNIIDEFIFNKNELKNISFHIHWFGKYRLIPFLTAFSFDNISLMKKYMSLVNKSRIPEDLKKLDFLSYIEFISFDEIFNFRDKKHDF